MNEDRIDANRETLRAADLCAQSTICFFTNLLGIDRKSNPENVDALIKEIEAGLTIQARLTFDVSGVSAIDFYIVREGCEPQLIIDGHVRKHLND